jgi:hypothetical protein
MKIDCRNMDIMKIENGNGIISSTWGVMHSDGSDLRKMSDGDTTSFDSVEYEDEPSFPYVVPAEQPLIVGHHQALFEKPATHYARQTACRIVGSDPTATAKEGYVAHGGLRYHPLRVPQEDIRGTSGIWETETGPRCFVMTAVSSLRGSEWRGWGSKSIQKEGDRVA